MSFHRRLRVPRYKAAIYLYFRAIRLPGESPSPSPSSHIAAMPRFESTILDLKSFSVDGHPLSQDATLAERLKYREDVLKLPGPVDRWLTANARMPRLSFLHSYLMFTGVQNEHVTCLVEREYTDVSAIININIITA